MEKILQGNSLRLETDFTEQTRTRVQSPVLPRPIFQEVNGWAGVASSGHEPLRAALRERISFLPS